jgi:hypothetical protein
MKGNLYIWIIFIGLSVAFATVSVLVYFSRGKNKFLIAKKIRIGALIISLTGAVNSCAPPVVTCYKPAPVVNVVPRQLADDSDKIIIDTEVKSIVFDCTNIYADSISYRIKLNEDIVERSNCVISNVDYKVILTINFEEKFKSGYYSIELLYGGITQTSDTQTAFETFELLVKDSK